MMSILTTTNNENIVDRNQNNKFYILVLIYIYIYIQPTKNVQTRKICHSKFFYCTKINNVTIFQDIFLIEYSSTCVNHYKIIIIILNNTKL